MTEIKIRPIGERFEDNGVMLEVVKVGRGCRRCYYVNSVGGCSAHKQTECAAPHRPDKTNVIFKEIKP